MDAVHDARRLAILVLGCWLVLLAAACLPAQPASAPLVGGFLADNRPHELVFLDLSEPAEPERRADSRSITGALTIATVDDDRGPRVDTVEVRGTSARGDSLTLSADRFLGRPDATLTLARTGQDVTLSLPSDAGEPQSLPLGAATADEFNALLGAWAAEADVARRERASSLSRAADERRATADLDRALADVRTSTRRIADLAADARNAVIAEEVQLQSLAGFVLQLKRDAARDAESLDARCSVARFRRQNGDRTSLESAFAAQRSKLADPIERLETELSSGRRGVALARERRRQLDEAHVTASSEADLDAGAPPDEQRALEAHATAAEGTRRTLDTVRRTDGELRTRTGELLNEGRAILADTSNPDECKPRLPEPEALTPSPSP